VLANVGAELVPGALGFGGGLNRGVDLIADLLPHRRGLVEAGVVTAGVEGDGNVKDGFASLQADLRAAGSMSEGGFWISGWMVALEEEEDCAWDEDEDCA